MLKLHVVYVYKWYAYDSYLNWEKLVEHSLILITDTYTKYDIHKHIYVAW